MIVFCFFKCLLATLWGYNDSELILPTHVLKTLLCKAYKPQFSSLVHQCLCRLYIQSSTRHHIFVCLTTFLYPLKICIHCVDPCTKVPKCLWLCLLAKIEAFDKYYPLYDWSYCAKIWILDVQEDDLSACKRVLISLKFWPSYNLIKNVSRCVPTS